MKSRYFLLTPNNFNISRAGYIDRIDSTKDNSHVVVTVLACSFIMNDSVVWKPLRHGKTNKTKPTFQTINQYKQGYQDYSFQEITKEEAFLLML